MVLLFCSIYKFSSSYSYSTIIILHLYYVYTRNGPNSAEPNLAVPAVQTILALFGPAHFKSVLGQFTLKQTGLTRAGPQKCQCNHSISSSSICSSNNQLTCSSSSSFSTKAKSTSSSSR